MRAQIRQRELEELTDIWRERGLDDKLATQVAEALTAHDAVRAHARDELGIDIDDHPNPWHAAAASAVRPASATRSLPPSLSLAGGRCRACASLLSHSRATLHVVCTQCAHVPEAIVTAALPHTPFVGVGAQRLAIGTQCVCVKIGWSCEKSRRTLMTCCIIAQCSAPTLCVQVSFAGGAGIPTLPLLLPDPSIRYWGMVVAITVGLLFFGGLGAKLGGFSPFRGGMRVLLGGWLAMIVTFGVGQLFGESPA